MTTCHHSSLRTELIRNIITLLLDDTTHRNASYHIISYLILQRQITSFHITHTTTQQMFTFHHTTTHRIILHRPTRTTFLSERSHLQLVLLFDDEKFNQFVQAVKLIVLMKTNKRSARLIHTINRVLFAEELRR